MVVPVKWERRGPEKATTCSTHPEAPAGLVVLPGICGEEDEMSVVVENESQLAIHVTDRDPIVIGCDEEQVPTMDDCRVVREQHKAFRAQVDFEGRSDAQDDQRIVESGKKKGNG